MTSHLSSDGQATPKYATFASDFASKLLKRQPLQEGHSAPLKAENEFSMGRVSFLYLEGKRRRHPYGQR